MDYRLSATVPNLASGGAVPGFGDRTDFQRPISFAFFRLEPELSCTGEDDLGSTYAQGIHLTRLYFLDPYYTDNKISNDLTTITNLLIVAPISVP